jgi:hypothetical protein
MEILKKTVSIIVSVMLFLIFTIYLKSMLEYIFIDGYSGKAIAINFIKFNFIIFSSFAGSIVGTWILFILIVKLFNFIFNPETKTFEYPNYSEASKNYIDSAIQGGDVSIDDTIINRVGELTLQYMETNSITEFDLNDYSNTMFKLFAFLNVRGVEFPLEKISDKRNYIENCLSKFHNFEIKNSKVKLIRIQSNKEKMDSVYSDKKESTIGWNTIEEEEKIMRTKKINGVITEEELKDYFENVEK